MKNLVFYFTICMLFMSVKCEDTEEDYLDAGIESVVKGRVIDTRNNLPVVDQKFVVSEYVREFRFSTGGREAFVQYVDSVNTDLNGEFNFTFETTGMGTIYKIGPKYNERVYGTFEEEQELYNVGGLNQFDFFSSENLYSCTLRISLNDLEHPPYNFSIQTHYHRPKFTISDTTGTVENTVYLRRDLDYTLYFTRVLDDGTRQQGQFSVAGQDSLDNRIIDLQLTNADFQ